GIYCVLFFISVYVLVVARRDKVNRLILITAILMFALSTVHVAFSVVREWSSSTSEHNKHPAAIQLWTWSCTFRQALYTTQNIVVDGLLIYRCYIIWRSGIKIVIIPLMLLFMAVVSGYGSVYQFSKRTTIREYFDLSVWSILLFSLILATNLIVTALISIRLWTISHEASEGFGMAVERKTNQALAIVLESGTVYSASLLVLLIMYRTKSTGIVIVFDAISQIMGIVPTLIIVRSGLGFGIRDLQRRHLRLNLSSSAHSLMLPKLIQIDDKDWDSLEDGLDAPSSVTMPPIARHRQESPGVWQKLE
ncbi:hypothetical protein C8J56DRAFT_768188, partial [Mycena floridula]